MPNRSILSMLFVSVITSLASPLAMATSNTPPESLTSSELRGFLHDYFKAFLSGNSEKVLALLRDGSSDFRDRVLAQGEHRYGPLAIAAQQGRTEMMCALLTFAVENPSYAKAIFAGVNNMIRLYLDDPSKIDGLRLLLDFANTYPEYRALILESPLTGPVLLNSAVYRGNVEAVRALLEFAAADSENTDLILPDNLGRTLLLNRAIRKADIPCIRALLESPFWHTFLDDIVWLPKDPEKAHSILMVLLEYDPSVLCALGQSPDTGLLEAAVIDMNRDLVRKLLLRGVGLEGGGELLNAMLRNHRNFEREQFRSFVGVLESLRLELMPPQVQDRAQSLLEQALLNNPPLEEQATPQTAQTLDQIIRAIRSRLLPNLQTLSLEAFGRGVRNLGQYGERGQFASEDSAHDAIRRAHEQPSLGHENLAVAQLPLENGILPGARLFASGIPQYLIYFYFAQNGVLPGGTK